MTEPETNSETAGKQRAGLAHLAEFVAGLGEGNRDAGTHWAACRATEAGDGDALAAIARAYHEHRPRSALRRQYHRLRPADGQPGSSVRSGGGDVCQRPEEAKPQSNRARDGLSDGAD